MVVENYFRIKLKLTRNLSVLLIRVQADMSALTNRNKLCHSGLNLTSRFIFIIQR